MVLPCCHYAVATLRRRDQLAAAGPAEAPNYFPAHLDESIRVRRYLRVPLTPTGANPTSTTWLVQLSHVKSGAPSGPSHLGNNRHNKKLRLFAGLLKQGREAADASTLGGNKLLWGRWATSI